MKQCSFYAPSVLLMQGDIYRPLALHALLVGDPKLGGIATTLSAYESLLLRGASVSAVVMMTEGRFNNVAAVRKHLQHAAIHR
jgi:dethiobiotin synthetase/adenosylmethionine--8-amino-7-oxononanoate aminotransferase